jgi:hypothetical protein
VRPEFDGGIMSEMAQVSLRWNKGDAFYFSTKWIVGSLRWSKEG